MSASDEAPAPRTLEEIRADVHEKLDRAVALVVSPTAEQLASYAAALRDLEQPIMLAGEAAPGVVHDDADPMRAFTESALRSALWLAAEDAGLSTEQADQLIEHGLRHLGYIEETAP